jgi:hypothetical protein
MSGTPLWTTFEDVVARWVGPGAPTDDELVEALILDAEAVITSEYPAIQGRIDEGTLPLQVVQMVTSRMVSRVLRNPDTVSYWQQQTGPFGQARNFGENVDIWLTENEKDMLAPNTRGKAFSLDLAPDKISPAADVLTLQRFPDPLWREASL